MEFIKYCEEKIDIFIPEKTNSENANFLATLKPVSLNEILQCPRLDHVAWVVPNLESEIEKLKATGFEIGKANFLTRREQKRSTLAKKNAHEGFF